ncbi:MAG: hypothetical protein HY211_05800 [Candidatus Omnitrophica bacterium]|nr:hypothetical protein [Candidatus Omnitrophota bacterium]
MSYSKDPAYLPAVVEAVAAGTVTVLTVFVFFVEALGAFDVLAGVQLFLTGLAAGFIAGDAGLAGAEGAAASVVEVDVVVVP